MVAVAGWQQWPSASLLLLLETFDGGYICRSVLSASGAVDGQRDWAGTRKYKKGMAVAYYWPSGSGAVPCHTPSRMLPGRIDDRTVGRTILFKTHLLPISHISDPHSRSSRPFRSERMPELRRSPHWRRLSSMIWSCFPQISLTGFMLSSLVPCIQPGTIIFELLSLRISAL